MLQFSHVSCSPFSAVLSVAVHLVTVITITVLPPAVLPPAALPPPLQAVSCLPPPPTEASLLLESLPTNANPDELLNQYDKAAMQLESAFIECRIVFRSQTTIFLNRIDL